MDRGAWRATVHGFTESDTHIGNKDPHMLRGAANTHTHTHTPHPKQLQNYTNDEDCRGEISSVQSLSYVRLFTMRWTAAHQVSLSINNPLNLLKLTSIESVMHQASHTLSCASPPAFNLSQHQRVF